MESTSKTHLLSLLSKGIGAGFLLVTLICCGAIWYQSTIIKDFEELINEEVASKEQVLHLNYLSKLQIQEWKNVLLRGSDRDQREKYWSAFRKTGDDIQQKGGKLIQGLDGEVKDKVQSFITAHSEMATAYQQAYNQFVDSNYNPQVGDSAVKGIDRESAKILNEAVALLSEMETQHTKSAMNAESTVTYTVIPIALVAVLLIAGGVIYAVNNFMVQPLNTLISGIQSMSRGDFSQAIDCDAKGEIGILMNDVGVMRDSLVTMIRQVNNSATMLDDSSNSLQNMMGELLSQSDNVQNRTQLLATATNEMTYASQEVANNASGAAEAAQEADAGAREGTEVMNNTIASVNQLEADVQNVANVMSKLSEDTSKIGSVLDVIKGIAEQTNLLALNAAIEAARAGEQGRGFAVVADEVRTLAQRTQESTEEIHQIISAVSSGTHDAIKAMEISQQRTAESVELSQKAGTAINSVTQAVDAIKGMNTQIATAAEEQSSVADDINSNINGVAQLAQETHEVVEQSRDITKKLADLASNFRSLAGQYRT